MKVFFLPFLLVALLFSCLQSGSWGWQGWISSVQCFGNSTGTDHSFQELWNHLECLWLSWMSLQQQVVHLFCRTGPSSSFPGLGQRGRKHPLFPRIWPPTSLPLWQRKTWIPHTDLSVSLLLSMGEEMPQLPSYVLLLSMEETLFPATRPVEWIILHIQTSKKKKWGLSHFTAKSCLLEQDKTLVPVFQLPLSSSEPVTYCGHILMLMFPLPCTNCLRRSLPMSPWGIQELTVTLLFCAENCRGFSTQRVSHGTKERNSSFALLRHSAGGREWDFSKEGIAQLEITAFKVVTFLCMDKLT